LIKYYLDENVPPQVADGLRRRGVDATGAHEVGMLRASDEDQLARAVGEGRCLVTRDRDDFIRLTVRQYDEGVSHRGVLITPHTLPSRAVGHLVEALLEYAGAHPHGLSAYVVDWL
jgi:predicted nuclease of predicted toxin-antitoxin system